LDRAVNETGDRLQRQIHAHQVLMVPYVRIGDGSVGNETLNRCVAWSTWRLGASLGLTVAGSCMGRVLELWASVGSRLPLSHTIKRLLLLGSRGNHPLLLTSAASTAVSLVPIWWRNTLGLIVCELLIDAVDLTHLWLLMRYRQNPLNDRPFYETEPDDLNLVD